MALGRAFIEVHADTKPFAKELGAELGRILAVAERGIVRQAGTKLGETVGTEASKGLRRKKKDIDDGLTEAFSGATGIGERLVKGLIDTIDDGLSGLPAELKLALGGVLVAVLPIAVALGAAIATGIIAGLTVIGLAGIGALIAAQFEEVSSAAKNTFAGIRDEFLQGARFGIRPFLNALTMVRERFRELQPALVVTFLRAGDAIGPVVDALLGLVEQFVPGLNRGLQSLDDFLGPLQVGFRLIGQSLGDFFDTLLNNDDAPDALYDLLVFASDLIDVFSFLVNYSLDFYGTLRDIGEFLGIFNDASQDVEEYGNEFHIAGGKIGNFGDSVEGTITPLEDQKKAIDDLNKGLQQTVDLLFNLEGGAIDFEQGLDDLTESLKRNRKDGLDITAEGGRESARILLDLARNIRQTRDDTIALTGDTKTAETVFEAQRKKIYEVGKQFNLTDQEIDGLIKSILEVPPPVETGVTPATLSRLALAISRVKTLKDLLHDLNIQADIASVVAAAAAAASAGQREAFGVLERPVVGASAGRGPAAVLPVDNPARSASTINTPTTAAAAPNINVYIGNDQVRAYIATEVNEQMSMAGRAISYGSRSF